MQKQAKVMNKGLSNVMMVNDLFGPLASRTWIYKNPYTQVLLNKMT